MYPASLEARASAYRSAIASAAPIDTLDPLGLAEDDSDGVIERRAMDRVQAMSAAQSVYGLDSAGRHPDDLQLDF